MNIQSIIQKSQSPAFKRSLGLLLIAEMITILAAWFLLDANINGWLKDRSSRAIQISQESALKADWSKIGQVPHDHDSQLFQQYRKTLATLSSKLFPQNDGDIFLVFVEDGKEYRIDPYDVVPFDYVGAANSWEIAAYDSKTTTYNLVPFSDNFGTSIAAFTPIIVNGKIVGLVAASYDSATITEFQGIVKRTFWYSLGPALLLSFLVAYAIATFFVEPLEVFRRIEESANVPDRGEGGRAELAGLSPKQQEVAEFVRQGLSNKEIAEKLVVSPETVKKHLKDIKEKTGFNKVDLAVHAEAARQRAISA